MKFIERFFSSFFLHISNIFGFGSGLESTLSTTSVGGATYTSLEALAQDNTLVSTTLSGTATAVSSAAMDASEVDAYNYQESMAYVQSMSVEDIDAVLNELGYEVDESVVEETGKVLSLSNKRPSRRI